MSVLFWQHQNAPTAVVSGSKTARYGTGVYGVDTYGEAVRFLAVRERPPLRLHSLLETPSGKRYRWAGDEPKAENVPSGERFSSTMPGGFESHDLTLPRKPGVDYDDLERLSTLKALDPGGEVVSETRLERVPQVSGDQMAVSPSAVGWQAALEDDQSAAMVYIDRDLSHWQEPTGQRKVNLLAGSVDMASPQVSTEGLPPGLSVTVAAPLNKPYAEQTYDPGAGTRIGRVLVDTITKTTFGNADPNLSLLMFVSDDPVSTNQQNSSELKDATSLDFAPTVSYRYLNWRFRWDGALAGGTSGKTYGFRLANLAVLGNHGLTLQGTGTSGGLLASDIIQHAVNRWAPTLNYSVDTIEVSGFVIPHLAFLEPTTAAEIIRQANRFHLNDWAVWEGQTFYYHSRGARGREWRARIAPAQLEETGPQIDRLWSSVLVSYQDVDSASTVKMVGPPGSGADYEDAQLVDLDLENPANKLGITRRSLLAAGIGTQAEAVQLGVRFLQEQKLLDTSGRAQLVGHVEDNHGVIHPAWRIRAGDYISFVDASDSSPRRIVKADYDHSTRTCSVDLDSPPEGLAALLERLGVVLVSLGVGS